MNIIHGILKFFGYFIMCKHDKDNNISYKIYNIRKEKLENQLLKLQYELNSIKCLIKEINDRDRTKKK